LVDSHHQRIGLIRARMAGGQIARGPFMVLIDGHTKPHDEWLRPIVKLLREARVLSLVRRSLDSRMFSSGLYSFVVSSNRITSA
jgi:cellulose synthase/poly-beta-1,6-N-acetylglucosamine synthase-like glycosyltransferase